MTIKINTDSGIADLTIDDTRSRASSRASLATLNSLAFSLPRSNSCLHDMHNEMIDKIQRRTEMREAADFLDRTSDNYVLAPAFGARISEKEKIKMPSKFSGFDMWWTWHSALKSGKRAD